MSGEGQAAGDLLTGAIVAATVESASDIATAKESAAHTACRNCGASVTGAYCSACGQRAHLHRSLLPLAHDLLHGVLHLEGKIWHTLPELVLHPGRLTRRYIDGERAKFVSPMALYLFTVFLMFAAFSFTTGSFFEKAGESASQAARNWRDAIARSMQEKNDQLAALQAQLPTPNASSEQRANVTQQVDAARKAIAELQAELDEVSALMSARAPTAAARQPVTKDEGPKVNVSPNFNFSFKSDNPRTDERFKEIVRQVIGNPQLTLYKIKSASYKYSWALIPLSVPFVWLLFFWRRKFHLYDHAIFVIYSISFMMLFLAVVSLAAAFGVSTGIWATAVFVVPPIHIYRQLRHTYGLGRLGAWARLLLLLVAISAVLSIFISLLFIVGLLG
jgi:hypothetical protein